MFNRLFNYTLIMTPQRALIMCIVAALFLLITAALYDSSAIVDAPVKKWFGWN